MRFRIYPPFVFILLLLFCINGFSQNKSEVFNRENGISNAMINDIVRDNHGVYWIATEFNGIKYSDMQYYKSFNSNNGLKTNDVLKLYSAGDRIFAATFDSGLAIIQNYKIKNVLKNPAIASNAVYDIALRGNQYILACKGGGMQYLTIDSLMPTKVLLPNQQVLRSYTYNGHRISGTSKHGFWVDEIKQIDTLNSYFSFAQYGSYLLAGTTKSGMKIYDRNFTEIKYTKNNEFIEDGTFITQIEVIGNNVVVSGSKFYIVKVDTVNWNIKTVLVKDIKPRCIYKDFNRLLVGTNDSGIKIVALKPFLEETLPYTNKSQKNISKIYFNGQDVYTICNKTNLFKHNRDAASIVHSNVKYDLFDVLKVDRGLLVCTSQGLEIVGSVNSSTVKSIMASGKFTSIEVNHIEKVGDNYCLSSNGNGLYVCNGNSIVQYNTSNKLRNDNIYVMHADAYDNLWCGYNNNGISVLKKDGSFNHFDKSSGLKSNSIECFSNYKSGVLIGTTDSGLIYFDGKRFINAFPSLEQFNGKINSVAVDEFEQIWVATDKDLYKVRVDNQLNALYVRNYNVFFDGNNMEVSANGIQMTPNQGLFFATNMGLFKYERTLDVLNSEQAILKFDEVQLVNKTVDWRKYNQVTDSLGKIPVDMDVSHDINSFTFKFHTVTLDEVKYSHRLISSNVSDDWSDYIKENTISYNYLQPGDYVLMIRMMNSYGLQNGKVVTYPFTIGPPFYRAWWFILSSILLSIGSIVFYFRWRNMQLASKNKALEVAVKMRTEELSVTNTKLSHSLNDITDSINYAKRLQTAILPTKDILENWFPKSFILFKPRDIVSGDFYWSANLSFEDKQIKYAVVADCTGHGVPGAFMSMIGADKLNNIIIEKRVTEVSEIAMALNKSVKVAMRQNDRDSQTKDGMDLAIVSIQGLSDGNAQINYAGANRPLWIIKRDGSFEEIKPNKMSIGGYTETDYAFQSHARTLEKGERIFMFTDGFPDQFGGKDSKKFMTKQLRDLVLTMQTNDIKVIGETLNQAFIKWQGKEDQVDDVLMWGIEI
jgi:serine phosphatase RsbU (regulator of sigma subunit)